MGDCGGLGGNWVRRQLEFKGVGAEGRGSAGAHTGS